MVAGPLDYTPGAMQNATKNSWAAIFSNPMSKGTRCQQLAMYVVYESPLQMLCDNPTHYYKEPECMDFLSTVPVTWDTTVVLQARVGNVVALARRAPNGDWYIGAMSDWTPRDLDVDCSFLGGGSWTMDCWQDGINADRNAEDFKRLQGQPINGSIHIHLAPGGGFAARITKAH
jgi:alpha-glucosidase